MRVLARRHRQHRAENHRDVLLLQQRRRERRLEAAGDDDADAGAIGERDGLADVALRCWRRRTAAAGVRRSAPAPRGSSRCARSAAGMRRVGARPRDQLLDALHARVALLLQILVLAVRVGAAAAAATAAAAHERRELEADAGHRLAAWPLPRSSRRGSSPRPGRRSARRPARRRRW